LRARRRSAASPAAAAAALPPPPPPPPLCAPASAQAVATTQPPPDAHAAKRARVPAHSGAQRARAAHAAPKRCGTREREERAGDVLCNSRQKSALCSQLSPPAAPSFLTRVSSLPATRAPGARTAAHARARMSDPAEAAAASPPPPPPPPPLPPLASRFGPDVRVFTFELPAPRAASASDGDGGGDAGASASASASAGADTAGVASSVCVPVQETSWEAGGLGWRVWGAAHVLSRELCAAPRSLLAGASVLEIGAGCGLCGFVASALGAREVVLTDALPALLSTLAASAALQARAEGVVSAEEAAAAADDDDEAPDAAAWVWRGAAPGRRLLVRNFLWDDEAADAASPAADEAFKRSMLAGQLRRADVAAALVTTAPSLPPGATFPLVIGSDLLYDWGQRRPLPRVLRARLAPGGVALLVLPVRDKTLMDAFCVALSQEGLAWDARPSRADGTDGGCRAGPAADGTGGDEPLACVDVRVWHPAAPPAPRWRGWPDEPEAGSEAEADGVGV
jgi:predicted nicotinamide N-methyase